MENFDPWLTQEWPWNIHLEIRRPENVSKEAIQELLKILREETRMKAEDIPESEVRRVAELILRWQTEDIEYLTVVEVSDDQIEGLKEMDNEEQEKVWGRVDTLISQAKVTIEFPEEIDAQNREV